MYKCILEEFNEKFKNQNPSKYKDYQQFLIIYEFVLKTSDYIISDKEKLEIFSLFRQKNIDSIYNLEAINEIDFETLKKNQIKFKIFKILLFFINFFKKNLTKQSIMKLLDEYFKEQIELKVFKLNFDIVYNLYQNYEKNHNIKYKKINFYTSEYFDLFKLNEETIDMLGKNFYTKDNMIVKINFKGQIKYLNAVLNEGEFLIGKSCFFKSYKILTPNCTFLVISIKNKFLNLFKIKSNNFHKNKYKINHELLKNINKILTISDNKDSSNNELLILNLISNFLLEFLKIETKISLLKKSVHNFEIFEITDFIDSNICSNITVLSLQKKFFLNKNNIIKLFLIYTGKYPSEYILEKKLQKACEYLLTTNKKITTISNELSFSSISTFSKIFKKKYSLAPSKFRKSIKIKGE